MTTEQVTITISTPDRLGVSIATGARALQRPAQVDLFAAQSEVTADQPVSAAIMAEVPPNPAIDEETSPEAATPAAEAKKPWEDLSAGAKAVNLPMSPSLYAKMHWITENVPKMSLQKIARQGAEAEADRLIALHSTH